MKFDIFLGCGFTERNIALYENPSAWARQTIAGIRRACFKEGKNAHQARPVVVVVRIQLESGSLRRISSRVICYLNIAHVQINFTFIVHSHLPAERSGSVMMWTQLVAATDSGYAAV